jgi:ATP synthase protein I
MVADKSEKTNVHEDFRRKVKDSQKRKIRARSQGDQGVWFGLGMFGLVGWSVAIPTLIAIALGIWIDTRIESRYSWTLMLLVIGITVGCLNAWYWITRERKVIEKELQQNGKEERGKGENNES